MLLIENLILSDTDYFSKENKYRNKYFSSLKKIGMNRVCFFQNVNNVRFF